MDPAGALGGNGSVASPLAVFQSHARVSELRMMFCDSRSWKTSLKRAWRGPRRAPSVACVAALPSRSAVNAAEGLIAAPEVSRSSEG